MSVLLKLLELSIIRLSMKLCIHEVKERMFPFHLHELKLQNTRQNKFIEKLKKNSLNANNKNLRLEFDIHLFAVV